MDDIGRTHAQVLATLWALEGTAWLEVQSEIHEAYREVPFWILLAPDASPIEAHRQFWLVLETELIQFGDYRVTVSYKSMAEEHVLWHGFFDDLDGVRRALTPEGWGKPVKQGLEAARIFRHGRTNSGAESGKTRNKRRLR